MNTQMTMMANVRTQSSVKCFWKYILKLVRELSHFKQTQQFTATGDQLTSKMAFILVLLFF